MNCKSMALREIRLPLREPFQISSGVVQDRRILLIELRDQNGHTGWGECVAGEYPNYSPETIDICWLAIMNWIAPKVLDRHFETPKQIYPFLSKDIRGHFMAKAAVEMAYYELRANIQGMPLSKLLGGARSEIATGISLGIQESAQVLVERAAAELAKGYRKIKIKIKPGKDVEFVRSVREALGPDAPLMADANNAYSLDNIDSLLALDALCLMMIEQPLAWDDVVSHAQLQKQLQTPICLDESITGIDRARDMIALQSGRIINIKPGRVGGFASSIAIHDFCAANGIPVWCGGMLESGIGRAHNVALASLPNFTLPGDLSPSARYWEQDIVKPEWQMDANGMVKVPLDKPGMGVEVDMDRIENLTVRCEVLE